METNTDNQERGPLVSIPEAAEVVGVSDRTIWRKLRAGIFARYRSEATNRSYVDIDEVVERYAPRP